MFSVEYTRWSINTEWMRRCDHFNDSMACLWSYSETIHRDPWMGYRDKASSSRCGNSMHVAYRSLRMRGVSTSLYRQAKSLGWLGRYLHLGAAICKPVNTDPMKTDAEQTIYFKYPWYCSPRGTLTIWQWHDRSSTFIWPQWNPLFLCFEFLDGFVRAEAVLDVSQILKCLGYTNQDICSCVTFLKVNVELWQLWWSAISY